MDTREQAPGGDGGALGLETVLVDSLPTTLLTEEAPDRYTVEVVFTRRPEREEVAGILSGDTRAFLSSAGYPAARLSVSDRRLEIANTSLEELRDGLADILADRLAEISTEVHDREDAATARLQVAAEHEKDRAAAVVTLARSVTFQARRDPARSHGAAGRGDSLADDAQIEGWDDEGGR
ncbi:MAG TPA: hypothetical protein VGC18_07895 [Lacisediminihabitans sp.]|uniref:hypothetical protein n=1 Tax=Lacisediminihabitans sp. TaxID=2787631 RepID=UPI002ED79F12